MFRYSASPPQTPAIILLRFERVSRRGFDSPFIPSSFVHDAVLFRLVESHPDEPRGRHASLELPPYTQNDVFCGRVPSREKIDVEIQVPPVELGEDPLLDGPLQLPEVHHVPGLPVDLSLDRDLEAVGVAVSVQVV